MAFPPEEAIVWFDGFLFPQFLRVANSRWKSSSAIFMTSLFSITRMVTFSG